jgi:hypothetical protein
MMNPSAKSKVPDAESREKVLAAVEHLPRGPRARAAQAKREAEMKGVSLARAIHMFKEAGVENLTSYESLRRAYHEKTIDGFIRGKNRIYFKMDSVLQLIGTATAKRDAATVDQALVAHYEASATNTPFTAMQERISPTLSKAMQVWNEYHAAKQHPFIVASQQAKQKETSPASEPSCKGCNRTFSTAQADHERVNRDVTGGRSSLDIAEEHALREFQGIKCPECWMWRPHAPVLVMHERLRELGRGNEKIATPAPIPPTHAPAGSGTNADGERNTHRGPAT